MKLQKQFSRKVRDKKYSKWVIIIPHSKIKELGWKEGLELEAITDRNTLIIKKRNK